MSRPRKIELACDIVSGGTLENKEFGDPFVAFVGAGASALPPSNLPTWNEFNNLLLECLSESLAEYSNNRQPTAEMLAMFRERREKTGFFAPDFQAQLLEEEVGPDYFRVWQSLETDVYGPVHAGLAELAATGRLAAIITTNFDRLIETALSARGRSFEVFHDQTTFEALAAMVRANTPRCPSSRSTDPLRMQRHSSIR